MSKSKQSNVIPSEKQHSERRSAQFKDLQSLLGNEQMQKILQSGDNGWMSFLGAGFENLQLEGLQDRYLEASHIQKMIESGMKPEDLGLKPEDFRQQNIAQMSDVAHQVQGSVDRPAAHSLRDANFWFYTLFANNGGSMEGLDMNRYREIAAMSGDEAAEKLPEFEAEAFEHSSDPATNDFGKALSVEHRRNLFLMHNKAFSPRKNN